MQTEAIFDNIARRLHHELSHAQHSIYIAVAWFTNHRLFDLLKHQAEQGICVQIILSNDKINQGNRIDFSQMNIGTSAVYLVGDGDRDLMHHKFCVIDGRTVINGSYNWSYKAETNHENILITKGDTLLAQQFIKQFKALCVAYGISQAEPDSIEPLPIAQILKRLTILNNYIALEDLEDIRRETEKLNPYRHQPELNAICHALEHRAFAEAVAGIEAFVQRHHQLIVFHDTDVSALKLEIRCLEHQITAYDNEKMELEKVLSDFQHQHTLELGDYLAQVLSLRTQLSRYDPDPQVFAEAEHDEQSYHEQRQEERAKVRFELNSEEKKSLKQAYRRASQICHPDRVSEAMKSVAQEMFVQLNHAYEQNDLAKVEQILAEVQQGIFTPRSETISEKSQLTAIVQSLRFKLAQLEQQIFAIKDSESYQFIAEIEDWAVYFANTKTQLTQQITALQQQLAQLTQAQAHGQA